MTYLPIMVECCWTAASSSLSRMVHSPMVMEWWQSDPKKQDSGSRPFSLQRTPSSASQDQPALSWTSLGYTSLPRPTTAPSWPPRADLAARLCERVSSAGPVLLCFPLQWRRGAGWMPSLPPPPLYQCLPLLSAVMLVLPLPHHSVLRYSICFSSPYDSHDCPLFPTCLFSCLFPFPCPPPLFPAFVLHPTPRALLVHQLHSVPSVLPCTRPCIVYLCLCCTLAALT